MNIKIGDDGSIIKGDEVISNSTVIKEDGTIETSNIANSSILQRSYTSHTAPVSPFENDRNNQIQQTEMKSLKSEEQLECENLAIATKNIADLEYELMVAEGQVKGSTSIKPIIIAIIMLLCAIIIHPVFFVGSIIAGILVVINSNKKSELKENVQRLKNEINLLRKQES